MIEDDGYCDLLLDEAVRKHKRRVILKKILLGFVIALAIGGIAYRSNPTIPTTVAAETSQQNQ